MLISGSGLSIEPYSIYKELIKTLLNESRCPKNILLINHCTMNLRQKFYICVHLKMFKLSPVDKDLDSRAFKFKIPAKTTCSMFS